MFDTIKTLNARSIYSVGDSEKINIQGNVGRRIEKVDNI